MRKKVKILIVAALLLSLAALLAYMIKEPEMIAEDCTAAMKLEKERMLTYARTEEAVKELNENSILGMELLSFSGLSEKDARRYGGDYLYTIHSEDWHVEGVFFMYPYDSQEHRLTGIAIYSQEHLLIGTPTEANEDYNVFGIRIGDDLSSVQAVMAEYGYEYDETVESYRGDKTTTSYNKGKLFISFRTEINAYEIISIFIGISDPDPAMEGVIY